MARKPKRYVYRLRRRRGESGWWLYFTTLAGVRDVIYAGLRLVIALPVARDIVRRAHEQRGVLTQLVVHKLDGRIAFEHTYGADPRRFKG